MNDRFTSDCTDTATVEVEYSDDLGGIIEITIARTEPDGELADDTLVLTLGEAREVAQGIVAVLR